MSYCERCGAKIQEGTKFCPECGAPQRERQSAEEAAGPYAYAGTGCECGNNQNRPLYTGSGIWSNHEVKSAGKAAMKRNYWICVLVGIISIAVNSLGKTGGNISWTFNQNGGFAVKNAVDYAVSYAGSSGWSGMLLTVFVVNIVQHCCERFMLVNQRRPAELGELNAFTPYLNKVAVLFLRDLFTLLWTLLFIIPGIIKAYEYRMVTYILAEHPDISWKDALDRSKEMMYGHKMKAFLLDLSFFGWILLGILTLGIVFIFYTQPYMMNTSAALYERLRIEF